MGPASACIAFAGSPGPCIGQHCVAHEEDVIRVAVAMVSRMCKIIMHAYRPSDVTWFEWRIRTWKAVRDMVSQARGASPATAVVASAAAAAGEQSCASVLPARSWVAC